jgi:antirestriction protein ArdC
MTVYEIITNRILEKLEKGTLPWHKPWKCSYWFVSNYFNRSIDRLKIMEV